MVSLWRQKIKELKEFMCLGIFIRLNWIFLTTECKEKLTPFHDDDIFMKYGLNAREERIPDYINIVDIKEVDTLSEFSIMFVSNPTIH